MTGVDTFEKIIINDVDASSCCDYVEIVNPAFYLLCKECGWDMQYTDNSTLACECGNTLHIGSGETC